MKEKTNTDNKKIEAMKIISDLRTFGAPEEIEIATRVAVMLLGSVKHISELKNNSINQKPGGENL